MKPFLVLGHRGSPKRFRENTIGSLAAALDEGADGFETDLRRLRDGTAVLFHDPKIGRKRVEEMTLEELRGHVGEIATVEELIARFTRRRGRRVLDRPFLDLEVKTGGWERELISMLRGLSGLVVSSFDRKVIEALRSENTRLELGLITRERKEARSAPEPGANWFFPRYDVVDAHVVARCHEAGVKVIPWSPDRRREWDRLLRIGCDGLITNLPREAALWREGRD